MLRVPFAGCEFKGILWKNSIYFNVVHVEKIPWWDPKLKSLNSMSALFRDANLLQNRGNRAFLSPKNVEIHAFFHQNVNS